MSSKRLLAVYNMCEIGGRGNVPYYVDAIRSLLLQNALGGPGKNYHIALSGCLMTYETSGALQQTFGDYLSYNFIHEQHPLSITFNDTINQMVAKHGPFDGYLYIDSGITFWDPMGRYDAVQALWDIHEKNGNAITAAFPSNDDGHQWWGIQYRPGEDYVFPVGKTTNMHCQIFDESWRKSFGRILPDIFADHTMESCFSGMAAAINKKMMITQKVNLLHNHSMDGASIGSRNKHMHPDYIAASNMSPTVLLYKTKKDMDKRYQEGFQYGFGYEECKEFWRHDPDKFDENGAKDSKLREFYRNELFLKSHEFDYSQIKRIFVPGRVD